MVDIERVIIPNDQCELWEMKPGVYYAVKKRNDARNTEYWYGVDNNMVGPRDDNIREIFGNCLNECYTRKCDAVRVANGQNRRIESAKANRYLARFYETYTPEYSIVEIVVN